MFKRFQQRLLRSTKLLFLVQQDFASVDLPAREFYSSFSYTHLPTIEAVPDLNVALLPFQREGVAWMVQRERLHQGGIMADHLGMGKTVQMIATCLAADSVVLSNIATPETLETEAFRVLTVLRQLSKLPLVAGCSKINQPARDVSMLIKATQEALRDSVAIQSIRLDVDKWLEFTGRSHPSYEDRARAFLDDGKKGDNQAPTQRFAATDAKYLRTLVVVPAALVLQWKSEIETKVKPERKISVHVFHGSGKSISANLLEGFDFVVTTYDTLALCASRGFREDSFDKSKGGPLFQVHWKRIILDEAHVVRHSATLRWRAVALLNGVKRWAVTATPLHNSINDLQNLLSFVGSARLPVMPGAQSQEILDDPILQKNIAQSIQPILLRRGPVVIRNGVREVLVQLPEKIEVVSQRSLTPRECEMYNSVLSQSRSVLDNRSAGHIFSVMTKLRLLCSHHWLADSTGVQIFPCAICRCEAVASITTKCGHVFCLECLAQRFRELEDGDCEAVRIPCPVCNTAISNSLLSKRSLSPARRLARLKEREFEMSTKLQMLLEAIERMQRSSTSDKMIIFSHFTSFLDVMEVMFEVHSIRFARLDGTMTLTSRNSVIKKFESSDDVRVLIASKTATGVGLNLTCANHVVIIDPWWNPAIEEQAVHRCHRIGQKKQVFVSRFLISDSIEHYCFEIARKKKEFGDAILRAATSGEAGAKSVAGKLHELLGRLNFVGGKNQNQR